VTHTVDLVVVAGLAVAWLAAGLLAETLPGLRTARALLRRTRVLLGLVAFGVGLLVAVPVIAVLTPGTSAAAPAALLPAVPALVVLTTTLHRLTWLRRGAAAFSTAPRTPAPPTLQAAAAHPLVATPLQVTGLAALVGMPVAAGFVTVPGAGPAGAAIGLIAVAVLIIGIRHALRHSRLAQQAVRIRAMIRPS
jgi:predicted metal-binding membrane protein